MKKNNKQDFLDAMHKNPDHWKGVFYINSKDPRIIVPKLNPSMGWTVNFGHKITYIGFILIVIAIIAYQIWMEG